MVPIVRPPVERVEVELVVVILNGPEERIEPPVMVRPLDEESPPALVEEIPPLKVEVPLSPTIVVVAVEPM